MEQTLLIIVIALIFILVVLIACLTFIGLRFLKMNKSKLDSLQDGSSQKEIKKEKKKISEELLKGLRAKSTPSAQTYCIDHENEMSAGVCVLSGESFCEHCLSVYDNMKFGKKYVDIYLSSEWPELTTIAEEEKSLSLIERIYKAKKELWEQKGLPLIVQGQYKINVETDEIESFVVLLARDKDRDIIRRELSFINF